jgi:putative redox protein
MTQTASTNTLKEISVAWDGADGYLATNKIGATVRTGKSTPENPVVGPMEMLLVGLAGCSALDVIDILKKKRQTPVDFKINVRGNQRTDVYPKIYTGFHIEYLLWGNDLQEADVTRAIQLSVEKYCSVGGTLGKAGPVTSSYRILKVDEKIEQND